MFKKLLRVFFLLFLLGAGIAFWGYNSIFTANTAFSEDTKSIEIRPESSFSDVVKLLKDENVITNIGSFKRVAKWMNYQKKNVPSGKYSIKKGSNNREIVGLLRAGFQEPIKVTFNNVRNIEQLSGAISKELAIDSSTLVSYLSDPQLPAQYGYTKETFLTAFIPNTYQMYWDITPEKILSRLVKEHNDFWNKKDRKAKAQALEMTEAEVYTLASIVEKESQHGPERPTIAGLYLNRLKRGQPLQADPTVVFANNKFDLKRVLNEHLAFDSPYNTYKYSGLPPGPIYMPSIQSIDAVLDYEKHSYLYMCAKPGYGTKHAFAKTLRGHNRNANEYRAWLNSEGIR